MSNQFPNGGFGQQPMQQQPVKSNTGLIIALIVGGVFLFMLIGCGVFAALLFPAVNAARDAARTAMDSNGLKQIGLAIHNYHSTYNCLPPAYTIDSESRPLLSWRVAILPFIDQQPLAERVDWTKPWDAPENKHLLDQMPEVFRSKKVDDTQVLSNMATVFTIRSPETAFPGPNDLEDGPFIGFRDVLDGISNTICAVALTQRVVDWTKPVDLTPQEAYDLIQQEPNPEKVLLLMLDGSVIRFPEATSIDDFKKCCTRAGGEPFSLQ